MARCALNIAGFKGNCGRSAIALFARSRGWAVGVLLSMLLAVVLVEGRCQSPGRNAGFRQEPAASDHGGQPFWERRGRAAGGPFAAAGNWTRARAAHAALAQNPTAEATSAGSSATWQSVGPSQVAISAWNLVTGPVTSLAADPTDAAGNTVYLGTAGGGVWKSTNAAGSAAGVTFTPLTDNLSVYSSASLTSLSIGAVSVQPGGTGVVLAGTGNPNLDASYGTGLLRSANGGTSWSLIDTAGGNLSGAGLTYSFTGNAFGGFAWSTTSPNLVVAAVTESWDGESLGIAGNLSVLGIYYSTDAGNTWQLATLEDGTQVFESDQLTQSGGNAATGVVWNPIRRRFYAAIRYHGYYESLDGMTWTRLASQPGANLTTAMCPTNAGLSSSTACPLFQGALAVQPVTGDLFALTVDQNDLDQGLWRDICNFTSGACASNTVQFAQISDQPLQLAGGILAQTNYDFWLAAVPNQQDTLVFAGIADIWKCSLANGCAWRNTTNTQTCAAAHVAAGQLAVDTTFGSKGLLYFGNEAGLWRSTDAVDQEPTPCSSDDAAHFQNLNAGLGSLAQVKNFSEDPNNASTWLAALDDLGTAAPGPNPGVWQQVLNGEGEFTAIDPVQPDNWYATSMFGVGVNVCTQGTACSISAFGNVAIGESQVDDDQQSIPAPWILDPEDTSQILLGTCRVWRGPATGVGWSQSNLLSGMLDRRQETFCDGNAEIRSLAAAPSTGGGSAGSEQIYAGMAGLSNGGGLIPGHVFTATVNSQSSANTAWTDLYASPVTNAVSGGYQFNPGQFDVSSIEADPHDATGNTVYVTIEGAPTTAANQALIYQSIDAGAHWTNITANLPPAPANSVVVDPNDANVVYVALDTGVYYTTNVASCAVAGAPCWNVYGSGLPNAAVTSLLTFNAGSDQMLRAATWGRGIWEAPLVTAGNAPTTAVLSPASLVFAGQQVQTSGTSQTIRLENTGTLNLSVSSITITGDFTETDNCSGESMAPGDSCAIQVSFAPTATGARSGTMTVFANVAGGQLAATLAGTGLAPAAVTLTPSSLSFGPTLVGKSAPVQYVVIANTGQETVSLASETVSGDFTLSPDTCGTSLAANSSCTVGIVFTPTASGTRNGVLTVTDGPGTQTAALSGTGQLAATDALAPQSLTFPAQQTGTTSAVQVVTLTNSGDQALTGIAVAVTKDFTAANNCGTTLQGHGSCSISVAYAPTIIGAETGTLTVTDATRSQTVALSGTGLAPPGAASATPASIDFGNNAVGSTSSAIAVTVTNNGGLALSNLTATATAGFAVAGNACPVSLGTGAACQIEVTFSPTTTGPVTGTLTVTATNLGSPLTVALSGSGSDFSMGVSGSSSAVITSGQTATFTLQLAAVAGTTGNVALTCAGAPQNAQCSLNPASMALTGANTSSVTVSIATGVSTSAGLRHDGDWRVAAVLALALPLSWAGVRRRRTAWLALTLAVVAVTMAGCSVSASGGSGGGSGSGGGGGSQNQTPSGTYPITITGTMANITHTVQVTLTVQ